MLNVEMSVSALQKLESGFTEIRLNLGNNIFTTKINNILS